MQVEIFDDMISPTLRNMLRETDKRHVPTSKPVSNLRDKTRYVTHYRYLQFYLGHRLGLIRLHRIVAFEQRQLMTPFIQYCNEQRKKATTDFESGLFKLFANSFYGKMVENVRKRMNARLLTDSQNMIRAAGKATFKRCEIINSDLLLVESERTKILSNKPVAIGFTIFEFAKLVITSFITTVCYLSSELSYTFALPPQIRLSATLKSRLVRRYGRHIGVVRYVQLPRKPSSLFIDKQTRLRQI